MTSRVVDAAFLRRFETMLDTRHPEAGPIPVRIIGHGEITTVLRIFPPVVAEGAVNLSANEAGATGGGEGQAAVACKRMPMFHSAAEVSAYDALYREYERVLREEIGLDVVESELVWVPPDPVSGAVGAAGRADSLATSIGGSAGSAAGTTVLYIVQELLDPSTVGHVRLRRAGEVEALGLLRAALREMYKVFTFNEANRGRLEVGFDGQISNWAVLEDEAGDVAGAAGPASPGGAADGGLADSPGAAPGLRLRYFDTSTPLLRRDGAEQLDPELFLRATPSFLVWVIRRFMLADVMERYYDRRKVAVDLVANLYKEQRPDLVPGAVELVNEFLGSSGVAPVTEEEVRAYYREDARIWRVYLAFRKIDRLLHRVLRKEYPYILPGKVVR